MVFVPLLARWLTGDAPGMFEAPRASGFEDGRVNLAYTENGRHTLTAGQDFAEGDALFELRAGAVLTPAAVYSDREVGSELAKYAAAIGPGFDVVALSTFVALERARNFQQESVGRFDRLGAPPELSTWSPLTSSHWTLETAEPSAIDPELEPIVEQGITLALPLVDQAARRAYMVRQQARSKPEFASQEWVERQMTDDGEGFSQGDLIEILRSSFALVLSRRWESPPPFFGDGDEPAPRWGWEAQFAPEGPALLPTIDGVLLGGGGAGNAACGVPPAPQAGSLGAGVCIQARATRPIAEGDLIQT